MSKVEHFKGRNSLVHHRVKNSVNNGFFRQHFPQSRYRWAPIWLLPLLMVSACSLLPASEAQPGREEPGRGEPGREERGGGLGGGRGGGQRGGENSPIAVQTAIAQTGTLEGALTYTGTTRPAQQVALRAQVSGEITNLSVDVGDTVQQGAVLAQLDGDLQTTSLNQAQAELSARRAETAQAEVSIREAEASVVQAQATFDQAKLDAQRLRSLADQGALSQQQAEAAELATTNAQQALRSAQAQLAAQRQAVTSSANQINAQQAVVSQSQKQLSYADLRSPLTGVVLSRAVDIGDFVQSGATILELGDLSTLEVTVQVSELNIAQIRVGQLARVQLDAFPGEGALSGQVERIAPMADATSRLIPVQVTISNNASSTGGQIGSGLLARVQFSTEQQGRVVVPTSALDAEENTVFVVEGDGKEAKAIARSVRLGERGQNRVEILSGLEPGDSFVVQSDRPLTSEQPVRLSILSE